MIFQHNYDIKQILYNHDYPASTWYFVVDSGSYSLPLNSQNRDPMCLAKLEKS